MVRFFMRAFIIIIIFILLTLLSTSSVLAQTTVKTYYVSAVSGNDTNNGLSELTPWKTLPKVNNSTFLPGDTILFKRGETWNGGLDIESSGVGGKNITFGAYGTGSRPIINAMKAYTSTWVSAGTNIWRSDKQENLLLLNGKRAVLEKTLERLNAPYEVYRDQQISGPVYVYAPSEPNSYYGNSMMSGSSASGIEIGGSNVTVQDIEVAGGIYYGVLIYGSNTILQRCYIHNPWNNGISMQGSSGNRIQNNTVSSGNSYGIIAQARDAVKIITNNVISGNTVDHFSYSGIVINGYSGTYRTTANEIKNNTSFSNGDGVYLHYNDGTKVTNNTLYDNTSEESSGEGYAVGIQTGSNIIVEGNKMYNSRTRGIEIWGGEPTATNSQYGPSFGNQILRNYIYKNKSNGILLSSNGFVKNTIIAYNAIFDNGSEGILISHGGNTGTQIINNTTYNNVGNTLFYYQEAKPVIKNNLFAKGGAVTIYDDSPNGNNGFAGAALRWNGSVVADSVITSKNSSYKVGTADFVRPETGYFYLKTGSPFINAGQLLSYTTDIQRTPFSGSPDIGAFEFVVAVPSNTPVPTTIVNPSIQPTATKAPTPSLTKTPPCATRRSGDSDCNGIINLIDLEMWSNPYLHNRYDERSDFNYDSRVNLNDLQIWGNNYYVN